MFRVLSSLVQSVGTCLLIVGLCFQIYSLNSNRWITWVTQDANEGLFYFEGKSKWTVDTGRSNVNILTLKFYHYVDCPRFPIFRRIKIVDGSIFSVNQLFRIMESMYDSTKGSCDAMGLLELERTFNFKRWKLSYLFSHSNKVWIIVKWLIQWRHQIFVSDLYLQPFVM